MERGELDDIAAARIQTFIRMDKSGIRQKPGFGFLRRQLGRFTERNGIADIDEVLDFNAIDRDGSEIIKSLGQNATEEETLTVVNNWNRLVNGLIDLAPVTENIVFNGRQIKAGTALEVGQRFLRRVGVGKNQAQQIAYSVARAVDNYTHTLRTYTELYAESIKEIAQDFNVKLASNKRLLSALDAGDDVLASQIQELSTGERIVYQQTRAWLKSREKLILKSVREELRSLGISPNEALRYEAEFSKSFFRNNWYARKWKNPKGDLIDRNELTFDDFQDSVSMPLPGAFRSRSGDWTVDELLDAGFTPLFDNPIDTLSDSMYGTFSNIIQSSLIREFKRNGFILRQTPREIAENVVKYGSPEGELGSSSSFIDTRQVRFNPDRFVKGDLTLNDNPFIRTLVDRAGLSGSLREELIVRNYSAPTYITPIMKFVFGSEETLGVKGLIKISQGLKILKLFASPLQFVDFAGYRALRVAFNPSLDNWLGAKGLINFPRLFAKSARGLFDPRVPDEIADIASGKKPLLLGELGDGQKVYFHEVAENGLSSYHREIIKISQVNPDQRALGNLANYIRSNTAKDGLASKFANPAAGAINFVDNIAKGAQQISSNVQRGIFEGAGGLIQIEHLKNNFPRVAREAAEKGWDKHQVLRELADSGNLLVSSQRYTDSIINTPTRDALVTLFLFSAEPESFLRTSLRSFIGAATLATGRRPSVQNDIWVRHAVAGFIWSAGAANALHCFATQINDGECQPLPLDRYAPFEFNPYSSFKFSYNNDFLAADTVLKGSLGPLRVDSQGQYDTFLRAADPKGWVESRFSQLVRFLWNVSSGETFFGEPLGEGLEWLKNMFLDFGLPLGIEQAFSSVSGRGEGSRVGQWAWVQSAINLSSPNLDEGQVYYAKQWAKAELGREIEEFDDLTEIEKRQFKSTPLWLETQIEIARAEYDRSSSQRNRFERFRAEGLFTYEQGLAVRDLLLLLRGDTAEQQSPADSLAASVAASLGRQSNRSVNDYLVAFNAHLRSANTTRVNSFQQIYNTFARAQLEGLEPGPVVHPEDEVIRQYWDIIDNSYSEGSAINFVYEIFNEKLQAFYEAGGNEQLGRYRRETVAAYRAAGPEPRFVQQLQTLVFADEQDIANLENELNRDFTGASIEEIILSVVAGTGEAGRGVVNSYLIGDQITNESVEALFNPKLIELGREKNEQLRE